MKRTISFILALVLLIGLMPMQAFATETQYTEPTVVTEVESSAANTSISSKPDLFVFAGQSNMMGAAVLEPEVNTFTEQAWEYKYMPKLRGAETGTFVPAQNSAGEWYYNDLNAAYGDYLNDLTYQSSLSNYSQNTYFCPAMSNGTKGFSAQSEANMYPSASLPPYFVTEYASYGHSSIYAHMAKGSVKIVHYFTTDMMDTYNALISEYNAENGKSYKLLTTADLTGAGDAFDEKYESMLEDYAACTPDGSINNKCFVWLQGESDGSSYIEYKLKMRVLWEHLQTLGFTHFFVLRVGYWGNTGILDIIKAQEDFCAENEGCYIVTRAPSLIPHPTATTENWWINEPDAQYADCRDSYVVPGSGNHHFNEKAMQIFAERSAENIHRILYQGLDPILEEENIQGLVKEEQKPEEEQPEDTTPYTSYVGTEYFNKGLSVSTSSGEWVEKTSSTAASTDLIPVTSDDSVWIQYVFYLSEAHAVGGFYDKDGNLVAPLYYKDFGFSLGGGGGTAAFLTPEATNRVSIADVESATGKEIAYVRFTAWQASAGGHANTEARIYHSHSYTPTVTAPTCTEQGYTTYTCECGDSYVDDYVEATGEHSYENGVCIGCGANAPVTAKPMSMRYDDHVDMTDKVIEIIDAGTPTSYQVGYGVEENKVLDTAVVTLNGNTLVATGIGTATVKIDGETYEITVTAAPISLLLLIGQSNMRGSEGNADQSIVCPDGMVYATFGDDRGDAEGIMNVNNATNFAASALTGEYSTINVNGTTDNLSYYPINSLTEAGKGTFGPDSGFAYEWVKQTGEKVWVVNAAHGGSSITSWQPNATNFKEAVLLFSACQETLRKEIAAGHFTLSHMGYFWCQGCSDYNWTAEKYVTNYLAMHDGLKSALAFDHDGSSATDSVIFEFAGIIPVRAGHDYNDGYREDVYTDTTSNRFYESFMDLQMTGPRVAQYWMCNNPELEDIWMVCNIGEDWVWMPDGTNGVSDYFQSHYVNGTVDYTTQVAQKVSWYTPTTPAAVHDSIHYNQIGYNEIGRESVRNTLIMLGEIEAPEVETTVELVGWDGYTLVNKISASLTGNSSTLVVPKVYPVWRTKEVSYNLTEGFNWSYYDILANNEGLTGALTMGNQTVTIEGHNWSEWETLYEASADGPGKQERTCSHCDKVETREIDGVWQIYDLADHLLELPEDICCDTNLWAILPHEDVHFTSGKKWGTTSTHTTSITIPVNPGDRIYATSWQKAGENGHATSNGIRVTFFSAEGIAKTMGPGQSDREFYANGGYLIAPEGTIAINIVMWYDSEDYEVYILNRDHIYENGTCAGCGDHIGPVITQQPESVEQEIGKKFAITVKAEGEGLTYQWYVKEAGAKEFKVSVNKTSSYAYTMQTYMHNRQVYCVITDANGNSVQTETATITRPPQALRIVEQPQDARVNVGEKFSISPKVEGEGLTYQWYVKESGAKAFKVSSVKGSAYALTMQKYMIGRQVYCVITDKYGNSVTTDVATISLPPVELKILQQPTDVYASKGEKFSISFVVQGDGLTYQWYVKEAGAKAFKVSSNKTSAYAYSMQSYMNNRQVYCVITDKYGNEVTTEVVTIHVEK